MRPSDEEMIAAALVEARLAGVPEAEIERLQREEYELVDELTAPILAGRLGYAARARERLVSRVAGRVA